MRNDLKAVAFCVQRRSIAAAVFVGTHLGFTDARQLPANYEKAEATVIGFVNWIVESFDIESTALEEIPGSQDVVRTVLSSAVEKCLRGHGVSIQKIESPELFGAFAHPPKTGRQDLRDVVSKVWPILQTRRAIPAQLDAAALGLYWQTDRLLQ